MTQRHRTALTLAALLLAGSAAASNEAASPPAVATADRKLHADVMQQVERLKSKGAGRREARSAIIALGQAATPALLERFADPDFTVRWEMVNIQGDLRDERAIPALVDRALRDESPHVRWRALWAVREFPTAGEQAATLLLKAAIAGPDRWNAAVGLSMLDDPTCLPAIHEGLADRDAWRRWEAINALSRVHDDTSARRLAALLPTATERERSEAVISLGKIGDEAAVDALLGALADPSSGVRWRACMSLGLAPRARAEAPLRALLEKEQDPEVRRHAERVLGRLAPSPPGAAPAKH